MNSIFNPFSIIGYSKEQDMWWGSCGRALHIDRIDWVGTVHFLFYNGFHSSNNSPQLLLPVPAEATELIIVEEAVLLF